VSGVLLVIALLIFWFVRNVPASTMLPIGPYVITYGGVWSLVTFVVVLPVLYTFSILLTMTTSPVALIEGLTLLLAPLRTFRLPVDDFALMALLALRFIPTLLEEVEQLIKAQAARGADLAHGTLRERIESLVMLFVPLLRGTLRRASELAIALDARGYESEGKQTLLHETRLKRIDYVTLAALLILVAGSILF
jgi:energy-coupling factor transport system permease protein